MRGRDARDVEAARTMLTGRRQPGFDAGQTGKSSSAMMLRCSTVSGKSRAILSMSPPAFNRTRNPIERSETNGTPCLRDRTAGGAAEVEPDTIELEPPGRGSRLGFAAVPAMRASDRQRDPERLADHREASTWLEEDRGAGIGQMSVLRPRCSLIWVKALAQALA
jgi:hypothetical protein